MLASVKKTSRALIVHEAQQTLGFGAEIAARLADVAFPWLDAPIRRVAYPDRPVPYARACWKTRCCRPRTGSWPKRGRC